MTGVVEFSPYDSSSLTTYEKLIRGRIPLNSSHDFIETIKGLDLPIDKEQAVFEAFLRLVDPRIKEQIQKEEMFRQEIFRSKDEVQNLIINARVGAIQEIAEYYQPILSEKDEQIRKLGEIADLSMRRLETSNLLGINKGFDRPGVKEFVDNVAIAISQMKPGFCGLGFIDLNGLKPINDTLGHDAGDVVIYHVQEMIQQALRSPTRLPKTTILDYSVRFGGDEFVWAASGLTDFLHTMIVAKRIFMVFKKADWAAITGIKEMSNFAINADMGYVIINISSRCPIPTDKGIKYHELLELYKEIIKASVKEADRLMYLEKAARRKLGPSTWFKSGHWRVCRGKLEPGLVCNNCSLPS